MVYVAAAWGFLQGLEYICESFNWPQQVRQIALLVLLIGLPVVLVLAWYHGDRGQQRISTSEFAILTLPLLLAVAKRKVRRPCSGLWASGRGHMWKATGPLMLTLFGMVIQPAHATPAEDMARAAQAFLATLDRDARAKAQFPFDAEERFNWHFVPRPRAGLPLKQMSDVHRKAAMALLRAGLSEKGYTKAETVRALEPILAEIENNPIRRDPQLYYFTIFGEPSPTGTWGWRFEGHHISLNWTLVRGSSIASTPQFFGSNPAEVRTGPKRGTRALAAEEELARALLGSLSEAQRTQAVISTSAPDDIFSGDSRKAAAQEDKGIRYADLSQEQRGLLLAVIEEYAGAQPKVLAEKWVERLRAASLDRIRFAWMGGLNRGERHYYRLQGPTFLIEYDNTQNDANHIHAVWRDFEGDFGVDLLGEHYKNSAHHQK